MNKKFLFIIIIVVVSALVLPFVTKAQDASSQASIDLLRQQIETLKQQIEQFESKLVSWEGGSQSTVKFTKILRKGMTDKEVIELQKFLAQFPDIYPEGLVTGYFGPLTETALKKWQTKQGIEPIGSVGPQTRAKLNGIIASTASTATAVTTATAMCDYPTAPTGCSYIQGASYNATTQCGLVLSCPTTTVAMCDYPTAPTGCSYIQGASYNATTQCGLELHCSTSAISYFSGSTSTLATAVSTSSTTIPYFLGSTSTLAVAVSTNSTTIPYFFGSTPAPVYTAPPVYIAPPVYTAPVSTQTSATSVATTCQNAPSCANAINKGVDSAGCIIWECPVVKTCSNAPSCANAINKGLGSDGCIIWQCPVVTNDSGSYPEWTSFGPGGGGWITTLAVSPASSDIIYAGCDVGGVYKTTNKGQSWQILNNGLKNYYVLAFAFNRTNPNIVYVGTQGGLHKSTDGGLTWQLKRNGFPGANAYGYSAPINAILVHPTSPNIIYAGVGDVHNGQGHFGSVYKSTDSGESWVKVNTGSPNIDSQAAIGSMAMDSNNPNILFAATDRGLYKSTDGGISWVKKPLPLDFTYTVVIDPKQTNVVYAVVQAVPGAVPWKGGVYKSIDGGETWIEKNKGLPKSVGNSSASGYLTSNYRSLAIDPKNPSVLYLGDFSWASAGVYKTKDGAENWEKLNLQLSDGGWINWGYSVNTIAIDQNNPSNIYFGDPGRIMGSSNSGEAWIKLYTQQSSFGWKGTGVETSVARAIAVNPSDPKNLYVGYLDVAVFGSNDAGSSFTWLADFSKMFGTMSLALDPSDARIIYMGTTNNQGSGNLVKSTDSGRTWAVIGGGLNGASINGLPNGVVSAVVVDPSSPSGSRTIYVGSIGNGIYKSINGGSSWVPINNSLTSSLNVYSLAMDRSNPRVLLAGFIAKGSSNVNDIGGVYKTVDGGATWVKLSKNPEIPDVYAVAIDPKTPSTIYAGAREYYYPPTFSTFLGGVYKSTDSGQTWKLMNNGFGDKNNLNVNAIAIDPANSNIIYAGTFDHNFHDYSTGRGVFRSTDGGGTWSAYNNGLSLLSTTFLTIQGSTIYVGTGGNGFFRRTLP